MLRRVPEAIPAHDAAHEPRPRDLRGGKRKDEGENPPRPVHVLDCVVDLAVAEEIVIAYSRILSYNVVMSEYGKLWQKVWEIREELKKLVSHACTDRLEDARRTCANAMISARDAGDHRRWTQIDALLERWADLERQMAACDD